MPAWYGRTADPSRDRPCELKLLPRRLNLGPFRTGFNVTLPPSPALKPDDGKQRAERNERQTVSIAPSPRQLVHEVEIHAIHAGNQGRRNPNDRNDREHLEDFV